MGQPIIVTEKPSIAHPGMVRFETNRALTGMGHERYTTRDAARGPRPPDELARRLFDHGGVDAVHINGNVISVDLEKGRSSEGMAQVIHDLYLFYPGTDVVADGAAPTTKDTEHEEEAEPVAAPRVLLPDGLASTSLVFGILGATIFPVLGAFVAIVTGHMALHRIKAGTAAGKGAATAGVLLGWVVVIVAFVTGIVLAFRWT